jgi:hypothetical protein
LLRQLALCSHAFFFYKSVVAANIQVIDGGTLVVEGRTVRLWGIEAPTATQTCVTTSGRSWPCGTRARDQLRSALQEDEIVCQPKAAGFEVCRIAGFDIGALLVRKALPRHGMITRRWKRAPVRPASDCRNDAISRTLMLVYTIEAHA